MPKPLPRIGLRKNGRSASRRNARKIPKEHSTMKVVSCVRGGVIVYRWPLW